MVPYPEDGAGPGKFPTQGREEDHREAVADKDGWELGIPASGGGTGGAGLEGIRKSVTKRQNMVAQYIATRPILDLCERATRRPGARVYRQW